MLWVAAVAVAATASTAEAAAGPPAARPVAAEARWAADCDEPRSLLQVHVSVAQAGVRRQGADEAPAADELLRQGGREGFLDGVGQAVVPSLPPASVQDADYVTDDHPDIALVPMMVIHRAVRQIREAQLHLDAAREQARQALRNSSELAAALEAERQSGAAINVSAANETGRLDVGIAQIAQLKGTMKRARQLRDEAKRAAQSLMKSRNQTISIPWTYSQPAGAALASTGSSAVNLSNASSAVNLPNASNATASVSNASSASSSTASARNASSAGSSTASVSNASSAGSSTASARNASSAGSSTASVRNASSAGSSTASASNASSAANLSNASIGGSSGSNPCQACPSNGSSSNSTANVSNASSGVNLANASIGGSSGSSLGQTVSGTVNITWDSIAPLRDQLEGRFADFLALAREAGELEDAAQKAIAAAELDEERSEKALLDLARQLSDQRAAEANLSALYAAANATVQDVIGKYTAGDDALKMVNASLTKFWRRTTTSSPGQTTNSTRAALRTSTSTWVKLLVIVGVVVVGLLLAILGKLAG